MDDVPARLWLDQAHSDLRASELIFNPSDHGSFCQTVAKHQQVVEKSVKAVAAALRTSGRNIHPIGFSHSLDSIISAIFNLPHRKDVSGILNRVRILLDEHTRGEIAALIALAPKRPAPGQLALKNTEYPFQKPDGKWIAPCHERVFVASEVRRYSIVAKRVIYGSGPIVSALDRTAGRLS